MKTLLLLLLLGLLVAGCKKSDQVDSRRIPNNTTVWIKWQNWNSYKAEGFDVQDSWTVDSLSPESFTSYEMNFYFCHNAKGEHNVYDDHELQLTPSKETLLDKLIH